MRASPCSCELPACLPCYSAYARLVQRVPIACECSCMMRLCERHVRAGHGRAAACHALQWASCVYRRPHRPADGTCDGGRHLRGGAVLAMLFEVARTDGWRPTVRQKTLLLASADVSVPRLYHYHYLPGSP